MISLELRPSDSPYVILSSVTSKESIHLPRSKHPPGPSLQPPHPPARMPRLPTQLHRLARLHSQRRRPIWAHFCSFLPECGEGQNGSEPQRVTGAVRCIPGTGQPDVVWGLRGTYTEAAYLRRCHWPSWSGGPSWWPSQV